MSEVQRLQEDVDCMLLPTKNECASISVIFQTEHEFSWLEKLDCMRFGVHLFSTRLALSSLASCKARIS
jgi:hypothetical protein